MTPTEADALRRRLLRLAALLGVALVAVLVNAVLHRGHGDEGPANPIRAAAARTELEPGGHAATEVIYGDAGGKVAATGRGVFDLRNGRGRATFVEPAKTGGHLTVHAFVAPDEVYLRSPLVAPQLQPAHWLGFEPWLGRNQEISMVSRWSPPAQLRMLAAVGDEVEDLGSEEVLGVTTERYGGHLDLADYARQLESAGRERAAESYRAWARKIPLPIRVEVWVDGSGRLRRTRTVTSLETKTGDAITVDTRTDLTGFGPPPPLTLPSAGEVLDISPLFRWQIEAGRGRAYGDLAPRGPALGAATFHDRASGVCRAMGRREVGIKRRSQAAEARLRRLSEGVDLTERDRKRIANDYRIVFDDVFAPFIHVQANFVRHLAMLSAPTSRRADFEELIHVGVLESEQLEAGIRAGQLAEFQIFKEITEGRKGLTHRGEELARKLGLEACVKPFGSSGNEGGASEPSHEAQPSID